MSSPRPAPSPSARTRSAAAVKTAADNAARQSSAAPPPAPTPPPAPPKPESLSLIEPRTARRATPGNGPRPLPQISKLQPITARRPPAAPAARPAATPAAPAIITAAPAVPKPVAVDLISGGGARRPAAATPEVPAPAVAASPAPEATPVPTPAADPVAAVAVSPEVSVDPAVIVDAEAKIIHLKPPVLVKDLAAALGVKTFQINKELIPLGVFASQATVLEPDVVVNLCKKFGFTFEAEKREKGAGVHRPEPVIAPPPVVEKPKEEELTTRAPIVTVMGHVDHGKTSLLDAIRKTRVAKGEAGGITQHIGAYRVNVDGNPITFLDTPGHAAFTAMRARGANVTDIVILVVAADDGLMPQTKEAIAHAKAAKATVMVAINKIDLPGANVDRIKAQLQETGLQPDDWGGDTTCVPVSATKGTGIKELLDLLVTQAELLDLKAAPTQQMRGVVIEASFEPGRGPVATVIVQTGTLATGDAFICGSHSGKVKAMFDDLGKPVKKAAPSVPVKVIGFSGLPNAGDEFLVMETERDAKALSEERTFEHRQKTLVAPPRATLTDLFAKAGAGKKVLNLVLKSDVQGSLEAIIGALKDIKTDKAEIDFVHTGVGPVTDNDVLLASASEAVIIGFNVKVENAALAGAKREGVEIKLYSIIYELIDQVREAMAGLLDPETRETVIGHAEVKKVFATSKGAVAGCIVSDGRVARTARARVTRRRQSVYDGAVETLRRFQDEVKEVRAGTECGIKLGNYDEYQEGDVIEFYTLEKVAQKL